MGKLVDMFSGYTIESTLDAIWEMCNSTDLRDYKRVVEWNGTGGAWAFEIVAERFTEHGYCEDECGGCDPMPEEYDPYGRDIQRHIFVCDADAECRREQYRLPSEDADHRI